MSELRPLMKSQWGPFGGHGVPEATVGTMEPPGVMHTSRKTLATSVMPARTYSIRREYTDITMTQRLRKCDQGVTGDAPPRHVRQRLTWVSVLQRLTWVSVAQRMTWVSVLQRLTWVSIAQRLTWVSVAQRLAWVSVLQRLTWVSVLQRERYTAISGYRFHQQSPQRGRYHYR